MDIYVVRPGDSVDSIAAAFGVAAEELIYANQLLYPYRLAIGQAMLVPGVPGIEPFGRAAANNGYAYPFIDNDILRESLRYLSELSIFSYGFGFDGAPVMPALDESRMIEAARAADVRPILTLTPFGPDGNFNNYLISSVLRDAAARERLLNELAAIVSNKGYDGIDVDFEYILAEDRDLFTQFVADLAELMHRQGKTLSVAMAPKTSADQPGLLYEGMDYAALGAVADYVLIMTYEWGYTYSPPQPVAPLNWMRRVLDYAVGEIPPGKIDLGIANYAYDWTLPYVQGESKARSFGGVEAMRLAADTGAEIMFDEVAASPYFNYRQDGVQHEVWFEDVRSFAAKFGLIEEYGLRGGGWWQIMRLFRAGFLLADHLFDIVKTEFPEA